MSDSPRYTTLRDYLRVIRAQRWVILAVVVLFAGAALALSLRQEKVYTAEAQVSFRDIQQDLSVLGASVTPETPPAVRAAANADLITRPAVSRLAQRELNTKLPTSALASHISAQVSAQTGLVLVQANWPDPEFAARLANAYASAARTIGRRQQNTRIDVAIKSLRRQAGDNPTTFQEQSAQESLTGLKTLRAISDPVQIAERAQVPTQATSPRPRRNTFLGAIVGIVFALLVAFFRDSLDRRLRSPHDVLEELDLPVLGRVSEEVLGFSNGGTNGRPGVADADLESFRVLRANLAFLRSDEDLKTILVTSALPQEGKSTVAMALAITAAAAGKRTLLIECDLRRPSLPGRLGVSKTPGLSDYLTGVAAPGEVIQLVETDFSSQNGSAAEADRRIMRVDEGSSESTIVSGQLVCISAGAPVGRPAELLGSPRFHEFLKKVSSVYDTVILDTSPLLPVVDALELVPQVDGVLVCVRLGQTKREEVRAMQDALGHLPDRPTGVVVTGLKAGDEAYGYYYHAYAAEPEAQPKAGRTS